MKLLQAGGSTLVLAAVLAAQTPNNQSLNGKYFFRYVSLTTDAVAHIIGGRSLTGALTCDGSGHYSFQAQQVLNAGAPAALTGSGAYSVDPAGNVTLSSLTGDPAPLNARLGTEALIGSTTDVNTYRFDLLVAIPAPATASSNAALSGSWWTATLEFPVAVGSASSARSAFFPLQPDGKGNFAPIDVQGRSTATPGKPSTDSVPGATYFLAADGTGSANFGQSSSLLSGGRILYISADGNLILGASTAPGAHDILLGVKTGSPMSIARLSKLYWTVGLRWEGGDSSAYAGSLVSNGKGQSALTRRLHDLVEGEPITFTGANPYTVNPDGSARALSLTLGLGSTGDLFVGADLDPEDPAAFEIAIGVRMPSPKGSGVFLNPQGVQNIASLSPPGNPIAPGEIVALLGSGLAPSSQAASPPYPANLNGVTVQVNNQPAPIAMVSDSEIDILVPYGISARNAAITVGNNGRNSNSVTVPVASTAPGIYSVDHSGSGPAAVLHSDLTPVTQDLPATRTETILVYVTGLGAVDPPVQDGTAGDGSVFSMITAPVTVLIGGIPADVTWAGLAPGLPGVYQLNITIPEDVPATGRVPLAIATPDAFTDQVDLWID